MSERSVRDPYTPWPGITVPGAAGNGTGDDTAAIQGQMSQMAFWGDQRTLVFPPGRYRTTAKITQPERVEVRGTGSPFVSIDPDMNTTTKAAVIQAGHPGTVWELGRLGSLEGMVFAGEPAANDVFSVTVPEGADRARIHGCCFFRRGKAALWVRNGSVWIGSSRIESGHSSAPRGLTLANGEPSGVGLWMQSCADGWVENVDIAAGGQGLHVDASAGMHFVNCKVFNCSQGVVVTGTRMSMFDELRVDEHDAEGIVFDWGSNGNRFSGCVHNCGAKTSHPALRRCGLRLGSGSGNRFDLIFDNWDHNVTQPPDIDLNSPMQHGLVVSAYEVGAVYRPEPTYNRVTASYRGMRAEPIVNGGDWSNVLETIVVGAAPPTPASHTHPTYETALNELGERTGALEAADSKLAARASALEEDDVKLRTYVQATGTAATNYLEPSP